MKNIETPQEEVLKYHKNAKAVNVMCKNGSYYHIMDGDRYLGQGKSAKAAWKAASRNIDF